MTNQIEMTNQIKRISSLRTRDNTEWAHASGKYKPVRPAACASRGDISLYPLPTGMSPGIHAGKRAPSALSPHGTIPGLSARFFLETSFAQRDTSYRFDQGCGESVGQI